MFDVHEVEVEKAFFDAHNVEIEVLDQFRTPLTPEMIVLSMKNYKSWMNTGFYIEFCINMEMIQNSSEKEVRLIYLHVNNRFLSYIL